MSSKNSVSLIGRVGKDVELKSFDNGNSVANFSLATSERYKDQAGNKQESTEWHNITVWGKLSKIVSDNVGKGDLIAVEGKIRTRSYEDATGVKKYVTEIVADEVIFLGKKAEVAAA